jgi:hypothetical protein
VHQTQNDRVKELIAEQMFDNTILEDLLGRN